MYFHSIFIKNFTSFYIFYKFWPQNALATLQQRPQTHQPNTPNQHFWFKPSLRINAARHIICRRHDMSFESHPKNKRQRLEDSASASASTSTATTTRTTTCSTGTLTTTTTTTESVYKSKPGKVYVDKQFMYKTGKYYIIRTRCGAHDQFQKHEVVQLWGEIFLEECDKVAKQQHKDYCKFRGYSLKP